MLLTVVIPMYNEIAIAEDCAKTLSEAIEKKAMEDGFRYEIIFSDDGSVDKCGEAVKKYSESHPLTCGEIRVVRREKNAGKGSAVRLGMTESKGEYAIFTDTDLAYGVDVILEMLQKIKDDPDCDVLLGSRAIAEDGYEGYSFIRKLASKTYLRAVSIMAGFKHSDSQCGIKMFRGEYARKIFSHCTVNGWAFDLEALMIAEKFGCGVKEFPVKVINHRESKIHLFSDSFKMLSEIPKIKKHVKEIKISR